MGKFHTAPRATEIKKIFVFMFAFMVLETDYYE